MRNFIYLIIFSVVFSSCTNGGYESEDSNGNERVTELENELFQTKLDNDSKDKMIEESLTFFNEIKLNLETIQLKKDEIQIKSENSEFKDEDKDYIIEQIKRINFLREENSKKINELNNILKNSNFKIVELEKLIENLMKEICLLEVKQLKMYQ